MFVSGREMEADKSAAKFESPTGTTDGLTAGVADLTSLKLLILDNFLKAHCS